MSLIPPELMEILVCPLCRSDLEELEEESVLRCTKCGHRFPVEDGIPNMIVEPDGN